MSLGGLIRSICLTDTNLEIQYTKAMRLFKDEPKWTALNRGHETEANPHRKEYLQTRESLAAH